MNGADAPFLHHALVTAAGASPSRWMLVLHGILGSGGNFRTIAKRLAEACPAWGFVLVDLRGHGQSQGAPPPHTLASAADDLVRLERHLAVPVRGVMGHSFGGKVTLAYAAARAAQGAEPLEQAWVLDATPGVRSDGAEQTSSVLGMLEAMPQPFPSRDRFIELVMAEGHPRAIAEWLAMNVRRGEDGLRLRIDLGAIRALLESYFTTDLWSALEDPRAAEVIHVVLGARSGSVGPADRARIEALAARSPRVRVHVLERAGHWVHVDDPEGLLALLRTSLCEA